MVVMVVSRGTNTTLQSFVNNRWLRWSTLCVFHHNFLRERMPSIVADWLGEVSKSQPRLSVHSFVPLALLLLLRRCVVVRVLCLCGGSGRAGGLHQVTSSNTGMDFLCYEVCDLAQAALFF